MAASTTDLPRHLIQNGRRSRRIETESKPTREEWPRRSRRFPGESPVISPRSSVPGHQSPPPSRCTGHINTMSSSTISAESISDQADAVHNHGASISDTSDALSGTDDRTDRRISELQQVAERALQQARALQTQRKQRNRSYEKPWRENAASEKKEWPRDPRRRARKEWPRSGLSARKKELRSRPASGIVSAAMAHDSEEHRPFPNRNSE